MVRAPGRAYLRLLLLAAALAWSGPAIRVAQAADAPSASVNITSEPLVGAEAQDFEIYTRAMGAFQEQGFAGLDDKLPALRKALDRAPETYPLLESQGERKIVRADDLSDVLALSAAMTAVAQRDGTSTTLVIVRRPNVYPLIALMLGSEAVERGRFDEAIGYLDDGLRMQPMNWVLITEKAAALFGQRRWTDALALVDQALNSGDLVISLHAAPLLRKRGFSLVELGRLDEARAAYETSLQSEPGNEVAIKELEYISGLQAGAAESAMMLVAPGAKPVDD